MAQEIAPKNPRFTEKMRVFADEYVSGEHTGKRFNATAAARHAGYGEDAGMASTAGSRLCKHPLVREYMRKKLDEASMSAEEVLMRFTEIARFESGSVVKKSVHSDALVIDTQAVMENRKYIKSFGYDSNGNPKIDFHDAHVALRDIARVRGMLKDGLEVSGPGGGAVPVAMQVQFVRPDGSEVHPTPERPTNQNLLPTEDYSDLEDE